eukprot:scaffold59632_cov43-Prasinocladus_malaysianus.AAC.1
MGCRRKISFSEGRTTMHIARLVSLVLFEQQAHTYLRSHAGGVRIILPYSYELSYWSVSPAKTTQRSCT